MNDTITFSLHWVVPDAWTFPWGRRAARLDPAPGRAVRRPPFRAQPACMPAADRHL